MILNHIIRLLVVVFMLLMTRRLQAQADLADVSNRDVRIEGSPKMQYFLIGLAEGAEAPEGGYSLLLVLPGGDGSEEMNPFVRRIWKNALPEGFLIAQLVAVASKNPNQIVWPTSKAKDPKQTFNTEQFTSAVIEDVAKKATLNRDKVYALGWSSGGPAVYASLLREKTPLKGAFIAMSVFWPNRVEKLTAGKGKSIFLLQSPQDEITAYPFAEVAKEKLSAVGSRVKLQSYEGGHGWHGDVFGNIRAGMDWLITPCEEPAQDSPPR